MKGITEEINNKKKEIYEEGKQIVQILGEDLAIFSIYQSLILSEKENEKIEKAALQILKYFKCKHCGRCCKENPVGLLDSDIEKLYKHDGDNFFHKLDENATGNYLKMPCCYLKENQCSIHKFSPKVCKMYPFSLSKSFPILVLCPLGQEILDIYKKFLKTKKVVISTKQRGKDYVEASAISELGIDMRKIVEPSTLISQKEEYGCVAISLGFLQKFERYLANELGEGATKMEIVLEDIE